MHFSLEWGYGLRSAFEIQVSETCQILYVSLSLEISERVLIQPLMVQGGLLVSTSRHRQVDQWHPALLQGASSVAVLSFLYLLLRSPCHLRVTEDTDLRVKCIESLLCGVGRLFSNQLITMPLKAGL